LHDGVERGVHGVDAVEVRAGGGFARELAGSDCGGEGDEGEGAWVVGLLEELTESLAEFWDLKFKSGPPMAAAPLAVRNARRERNGPPPDSSEIIC